MSAETSAKTAVGVEEAFTSLARMLVKGSAPQPKQKPKDLIEGEELADAGTDSGKPGCPC